MFYPSSALFPREVEVGVLIEKNVKPGISGKHNLDIYVWGILFFLICERQIILCLITV